MKESVRIFPGFDKKKLDFLVRKKLLSNRDGVIAKNGNWRLSFSNSEARLLRKLDMEEDDFVYRTIKYFANISGLPICSYAIKVRLVTALTGTDGISDINYQIKPCRNPPWPT